MNPFESIPLLLAIVSTGVAANALACLAWHYRRRPAVTDDDLRRAFPDGLPFVSLLKPCKGADFGFAENLRSFLRLDGVPHEVLVGFASESDPGVAIARAVVAEERHPAARVVITGERDGHNPKVVNLMALERDARGALVFVSDSNVRAPRQVLRRLVLPFGDPKVGLSLSLFRGMRGSTTASLLQAALFSTVVVPALTTAYVAFRWGNLIGKCFILRPSALAAVGGWAAYETRLAEDGPLARDVQKAGWRVAQSPELVEVVLGELTWRQFWDHEVRWFLLNRFDNFWAPIGTALWNPWLLALGAGVCALVGSPFGAGVLLASAGLNLLVTATDFLVLGHRLRDAWAVPVQQAVLAIVLIVIWFRREVRWRGRAFVLGPDTRILSSRPLAPTGADGAQPAP